MSRPDTTNAVPGVIPNLVLLLNHIDDVVSANLCAPNAIYVFKTRDEGAHFCGYRNIQMLLAAQNGPDADMPTISDLQIRIEEAWKAGFNPYGMTQTGGIRGTRKHIGTSEVIESRILQGSTLLTISARPRPCY